MEERDNRLFKPGGISIRFTEDDANFWNENLEDITGKSRDDDGLTQRKAIMLAAERATSKIKIVERPVKDPDQASEFQKLLLENQNQAEKIRLISEANERLVTDNTELLMLRDKFDIYLVCIGKETGKPAPTMEQFFTLLLEGYQKSKSKAFVLTSDDIKYYESVKSNG